MKTPLDIACDILVEEYQERLTPDQWASAMMVVSPNEAMARTFIRTPKGAFRTRFLEIQIKEEITSEEDPFKDLEQMAST